jgi:hypothetical protein
LEYTEPVGLESGLIVLSIMIAAGSPAFGAQKYRVPAGNALDINEWGTCRNILNNASKDQFVSTNTAGEWVNAYTNPPSATVVSGCITNGAAVGSTGSGASASVSLTAMPTVGNIVIAWVWDYQTTAKPITSMNDNNGNTWVRDTPAGTAPCSTAGFQCVAIYHSKITTSATSPFTIVSTATGAAQVELSAVEVLNVNTGFDQFKCMTGNSTLSITGTANTTSATEFIATVSSSAGGTNPVTYTPQTTWSIGHTQTDNSAFQAGQSAYKGVTSTGAYSLQTTVSASGAWVACIATYK